MFASSDCNLPSSAPEGWSCDINEYYDGSTCHCSCGVYDPDCDLAGVEIQNCELGQYCSFATASCGPADNQMDAEEGTYLQNGGLGLTTGKYGEVQVNCTNGYFGNFCNDSCYFNACSIVPFPQFLQCINSLVISQEVMNQTIEAMLSVLPIYVFLDRNKGSPVGIDTMSQILSIQSQIPQLTSNQFQEALNKAFNDLNDAHTIYIKPNSYRNFAVIQYFGLQSFVNNGRQAIYVGDVLYSDLQYMRGWEVLTINNQSAMEAIIDFANSTVSISKDLGTRFNLAVEIYWQRRGVSTYSLPTSPTVTYSFKDQQGNIHQDWELPYLVFSGKSIRSTDQLMGQYLNLSLNFSPTKDEDLHMVDVQRRELDIDWSAFKNMDWTQHVPPKTLKLMKEAKLSSTKKSSLPKQEKKQNPNPDPITVMYTGTNSGISFMKVGDEVGVLKISTFSPTDIMSFYMDATYSLMLAQDYNLTKLILDLRDNGGDTFV